MRLWRLAVEIDEDVSGDRGCYNHNRINDWCLEVEINVKEGNGK